MMGLTSVLAEAGVLYTDAEGKLQGLDRLPAIVLASNGILDASVRERLTQAISFIVENEGVRDELVKAWLGKTVRDLSYLSGVREGFGTQAVYRPGKGGAIVLCGGSKETRERVMELTTGKESVRFIDGKEETQEREWRKAYTNLMTNVVGLLLSVDKRKGSLRLNIPVGRILSRMKPAKDVTFTEVEGAYDWCERLGKAFFEVARRKGMFSHFATWEEFNNKIFLEPLKNPVDFYSHVPSSLQVVANQARAGILPDGIPPNEAAILEPLIAEAQQLDLSTEVASLKEAGKLIEENIAMIKEVYRSPQITEASPHTIRRVFNQTGEIAYIVFNPANIGLSREQVVPFTTKSPDVSCGSDECIVPMTAEVFSYGPEHIPGDVAFITNGAGFTLEVLDRCVEAGVRLGFISDLRLDFVEGKYYLAMKMALAANPNIDTIALNVFSTLGTGADIARAIERIAKERSDLKLIVKMQAREQEQGIEILQRLKKAGTQIIFSEGGDDLSPAEVRPLTLDQMIRSLRGLDGVEVDRTYGLYKELTQDELLKILSFALDSRVRHLLLPTGITTDNQRELDQLVRNGMFVPEAVFGQEFIPVRGKETLTGKPVVVITGYGATARLQAKLMRRTGTEVVLLHPQVKTKIKAEELLQLSKLGISVYANAEDLNADLETHYPSKVDVIGLCYEPYSPEIGDGGGYSERIEEAVESLVKLKTVYGLSVLSVLIPTEMVPTVVTKNILAKCKTAGIWLIGPNSPGMSRTSVKYPSSHLKVGQIPAQCILPGEAAAAAGIGGTMLFETLAGLKEQNIGTSWAISLGGDRTRGLSARDAALIAERDQNVKYIVYIGEPGGFAAQELAEVMKAGHITKSVIVKLIGSRLPNDCYIGHAGAVTHGYDFERTGVKIEALQDAGAIVVYTAGQMAQVIEFIREHPQYDQIDIASSQFQTARQVMTSFATAQDAIIKEITGRN